MNRYLIDSNIIIKLWERNEDNLSELIKENKIVILKDVLEEISIKEKRKYKGNYILSQRFCELLPASIEIDKKDISGFYLIFDYENKDKKEKNKLSQVDLLNLYTCYINSELILVTEDKALFNISKSLLGDKRVWSIDNLISSLR